MPNGSKFRLQRRVSGEMAAYKLQVAKSYLDLTRAMVACFLPGSPHELGPNIESIIILLAVLIGDGEGRPMNATKLAHFTSISRPTVHRRLKNLLKQGKVMRRGDDYYFADDGMNPDLDPDIAKAISKLCSPL